MLLHLAEEGGLPAKNDQDPLEPLPMLGRRETNSHPTYLTLVLHLSEVDTNP
jgi:hypothetical protein